MEELCKANGLLAKESKVFQRKLVHWLMLRKLNELKRGVRLFNRYRGFRGTNDLELKGRLRKAASTIITCLTGDHSNCSFSFVCQDSIDPYLFCLPHKRNVPVLPKCIQVILRENVWDMFSTTKLDAVVRNSTIRTTSKVESLHRTIRNAAPKNKPLFRNETPTLKMGAAIVANQGKGAATIRHFEAIGMPMSLHLVKRLRKYDATVQRHSVYRKSEEYKAKEKARRRKKFLNHAASLGSDERKMYGKELFDHSYVRTPSQSISEIKQTADS